MKYLLILLFICAAHLLALDADAIIKKIEDNFRGDNAYMKFEMTVETARHKRTMKIESWSEGKQNSFMRILYPPREQGITFLKLNNQLWQYIPKIERTIKIPPSMMLQSWMGSDFTNDDLVKESSLEDDYDAGLLEHNGTHATIELLPKPDAAVVWGKIVMEVDVPNAVPLQAVYYDDEGAPVRTLTYRASKTFDGHNLPTVWEVRPQDEAKKDHRTVIRVEAAEFDHGVPSSYFSKSALKRYSR